MCKKIKNLYLHTSYLHVLLVTYYVKTPITFDRELEKHEYLSYDGKKYAKPPTFICHKYLRQNGKSCKCYVIPGTLKYTCCSTSMYYYYYL